MTEYKRDVLVKKLINVVLHINLLKNCKNQV